MTHLCPSDHELSRMFQGDVEAPLPASAASCETCRARWYGLVRVVRISRALPVELPSAGRREEVRAELLARANASQWPPAHRWRPLVVLPAAAAVVLVGAVVLLRMAARPGPARSHVSVHGQRAARYEVATAPPDETLRLHDGTIALDVEPLGPHERFRVLMGDDEIEVRGTSFEVTAASDRLVAVSVSRGHVDVRPRRGVAALLGPGQSWGPAPLELRAPSARPPEPERRQPARLALAHGESLNAPGPGGARPRPFARPAGTEERVYDDAWDAMRARNFRRAAVGFGRVVALAPTGALADEAAFWRAVALARDGSPAPAIVAFKQMLAGYPASPRRGEAAVILGWLLADAHQVEEAAALFRSAENDPSEVVRASARRGLAHPPPAPAENAIVRRR